MPFTTTTTTTITTTTTTTTTTTITTCSTLKLFYEAQCSNHLIHSARAT